MEKSYERGKAFARIGLMVSGLGLTMLMGCSGKQERTDDCVMTVYAQNEFPPYGAAVRSSPDIAAEQIAGVEMNRPIEVSGWTEVDEVAYPENPDLWAGRHWYQLADESGWVNIAGIRNAETDIVLTEGGEYLPSADGSAPSLDKLSITLPELDQDCRL